MRPRPVKCLRASAERRISAFLRLEPDGECPEVEAWITLCHRDAQGTEAEGGTMLFEVVTSEGRVVFKARDLDDAETVKNAWNLRHEVDSSLTTTMVRVVSPKPSLN